MKLEINGRELGLDGRTCDHIPKEVNPLRRRLPGITGAKVGLAQLDAMDPHHRVIAHVVLRINGTVIKGEGHGVNAIESVDFAIDVLGQRLEPHNANIYQSR